MTWESALDLDVRDGMSEMFTASGDDGLVVAVGDAAPIQVATVGDTLTAQWIDTVEAMARDFCS